jgi:hypothetical protein
MELEKLSCPNSPLVGQTSTRKMPSSRVLREGKRAWKKAARVQHGKLSIRMDDTSLNDVVTDVLAAVKKKPGSARGPTPAHRHGTVLPLSYSPRTTNCMTKTYRNKRRKR